MSDLGSDSCILLFDKYMTGCLSVHVMLKVKLDMQIILRDFNFPTSYAVTRQLPNFLIFCH